MESRSHQTGSSLLLPGAGPEHLARHGRPRVLPPQGPVRPCGLRGRAGGAGLAQAASSLLGPRPHLGHWDRWFPFPPAGAAPHAPGTGRPSVTQGTLRARLPEGPAQDLGSEHISCAHTLPAPDPAGHYPTLSALAGRAVLQTPPARSLPRPAVTSCRPSTPWPPAHPCPLGGQPSPLPGLFSELSAQGSVCGAGGNPSPPGGWGVLERGVMTPRDAQSRAWGGAGRPRGAVRAMPPLLLQLLPGTPCPPCSQVKIEFTQPENGIALLPSSAAGGNHRGAAARQHQAALGECGGLGHERDVGATGRP